MCARPIERLRVGGGCDLPVGALARIDAGGRIHLEVLIAALDGRVVLRAGVVGDHPETTGRNASRVLLDERGGRMLLEDVA